jgi:hypothetical protein
MSSEKDLNTTVPSIVPVEQRDPLPFTAQGSNVVTVPSSSDHDKGSHSLESSAGGDPEKPAPTTFPEGGFGWMVVFGAFMIQFWQVRLSKFMGKQAKNET